MSIAPQPDPADSTAFGAAAGGAAPAAAQEVFGSSLLPALTAACGGRLANLSWFRTDWQRGGAVTGYATWQTDAAGEQDVVVKLPVPPQELRWLQRLQVDAIGPGGADRPAASDTESAPLPVVPHLYAGGIELGGYDLAWVVMQRLPFGPLDADWEGAEFNLLIEAAARFHAAAARYPIDRRPPEEDWPDLLNQARKTLREVALPDVQRWNGALKTLKKKFKSVLRQWHDRACTTWCHGDLHLANAMTVSPAPEGPAILFDLARVHVGHWVEDAVYLEHLFWAAPQRVNGFDPVKALSVQRKQFDLPVEPDWPQLTNIRRLLLAVGNLAAQSRRPDPAQSHAALRTVEQTLPQL